MRDRKTILTIVGIALLLVVHDRVEYLYYLVDPSDKYCLFADPSRCFRGDSFVYYASIRIQQIILGLIIHLLLPFFLPVKKETKFYLIACGLSFGEYFFTYNEPFFKLPLPFHLYIPGSTATLKLAALILLVTQVVRQLLKALK